MDLKFNIKFNKSKFFLLSFFKGLALKLLTDIQKFVTLTVKFIYFINFRRIFDAWVPSRGESGWLQ